MNEQTFPVIDCHVHFIDASRFHYPIFPQRSAGFEALVGDYSALPRHYLPKDYAADTGDLHIKRTVWAEFMSDTPLEELRWAQSLADAAGHPTGLISWDPRGIGESTSVQCFATPDDGLNFFTDLPTGFPVGKAETSAWIRRYTRFGQLCAQRNGNLLEHVSTADTARDLDLLRRAVGDPQLNYLGTCYGTFPRRYVREPVPEQDTCDGARREPRPGRVDERRYRRRVS